MLYKLLLICLLTATCATNLRSQEEIEQLLQCGENAYNSGNYQVAERCYKMIVQQQSKTPGKEHDYLNNLKILLNIQQRLGSYVQGDSLCVQGLEFAERRFGVKSEEYMDVMLYTCRLKVEQSAWKEALQPLNTVILHRKDKYGADSFEYAEAISVLVQAKTLASELEEARQLADKVAAIYKKIKGEVSTEYATSLTLLGNIAIYQHKIDEAYTYYIRSRELNSRLFGDKHIETLRINIYLSTAFGYMGKHQDGINLLEETLPVLKESTGDNNLAYASVLSNLAMFYLNILNSQKTIDLLHEALTIIERNTGKKNHYYLNALSGLASSYQSQGEMEKAEPLFLESLKLRNELYGEKHPSVYQGLHNLGGFYYSMGNYQRSKELLTHVLQWEKDYPDSFFPLYISALRVLHMIDINEKQANLANQHFEKARQYVEKFNQQEHPSYLFFLLDRLKYGVSAEQIEEKLLQQEIERLQPLVEKYFGKNSYQYCNLQAIYAQLLSNKKEYAKAIELSGECIDYYLSQKLTRTAPFLSLIKEHAFVLLLSGNLDYSLQYYKMLLNHIQLSVVENFAFISEEERARYWQIHTRFCDEIRLFAGLLGETAFIELVYDNELLTKSMLLQSNIQIRRFIQESGDEDLQKLWKELAVVKKQLTANMSPMTEISPKRIRSLKEKEMALEKELLYKCKVYGVLMNELVKSMKEVQKALATEEAAIEFVATIEVADDGKESTVYHALLLNRENELPVAIRLCYEEDLRNALERGDNKEVSRLVWQPLQGYLSGKQCLFISPVGLLHTLSFNALQNKEGQYALEEMDIHNLLTTKDIIKLKQKNEFRVTTKKALLMGGADYDLPYVEMKMRVRSQGFEYLPGAVQEVDSIAHYLRANHWTVHTLTDEDATKTNWIRFLSEEKPSLLHLATHGYYSAAPSEVAMPSTFKQNAYETAEDPLFRSGLLFTGCNYIWAGDAPIDMIDDGVLSAYEASNLDLSNLELLVLSACLTGLGDVQGNEGVFGLQRAFRLAGAKRMIVSLREVFDEDTFELMKTFYEIWDKESNPQPAFRKALITMKNLYPENPQKWNGFLMIE